ncbi:MAG TPA: GNAT family N-acetyltransferase [Polyangiaceae bacterium]|nr:GNAT family N-acetyltransferase [Polyangiaceae bacterium]
MGVTRREPQLGDVFAVRRGEGEELVGRVVSTSAVVGPTHGCLVVYLYRDEVARPKRERLLVPPILTTRGPWSRGYFAHLRSEPLLPGDYFERHVFRDARGGLVDDEARPLDAPEAGEPVGEWRLFDVEAIEGAVAAALARLPALAARAASGAPREASTEGEYAVDEHVPSVDEYVRLRREAGLGAKTPEAARVGLANTWFGVTVRLGGEAVAMGRVIGDGGCFFEVVDIAVQPAHQRRGLGKRIMGALMEHLRANAPASAHVMLLADGPAHLLYEKFGFRPTAPASIGMELRL